MGSDTRCVLPYQWALQHHQQHAICCCSSPRMPPCRSSCRRQGRGLARWWTCTMAQVQQKEAIVVAGPSGMLMPALVHDDRTMCSAQARTMSSGWSSAMSHHRMAALSTRRATPRRCWCPSQRTLCQWWTGRSAGWRSGRLRACWSWPPAGQPSLPSAAPGDDVCRHLTLAACPTPSSASRSAMEGTCSRHAAECVPVPCDAHCSVAPCAEGGWRCSNVATARILCREIEEHPVQQLTMAFRARLHSVSACYGLCGEQALGRCHAMHCSLQAVRPACSVSPPAAPAAQGSAARLPGSSHTAPAPAQPPAPGSGCPGAAPQCRG